jgi:MinD superfamily P-loop ATPase
MEIKFLAKRVLDLLDSLRTRVMQLTNRRSREINIDVFANPEKYLIRLPIDKIVADTKVSREAINLYKQKNQKRRKACPINCGQASKT